MTFNTTSPYTYHTLGAPFGGFRTKGHHTGLGLLPISISKICFNVNQHGVSRRPLGAGLARGTGGGKPQIVGQGRENYTNSITDHHQLQLI